MQCASHIYFRYNNFAFPLMRQSGQNVHHQNDCQIENSTAKLLHTLDATRVTYAKAECRKKAAEECDDVEYEKLRQLLSFEDVMNNLEFIWKIMLFKCLI